VSHRWGNWDIWLGWRVWRQVGRLEADGEVTPTPHLQVVVYSVYLFCAIVHSAAVLLVHGLGFEDGIGCDCLMCTAFSYFVAAVIFLPMFMLVFGVIAYCELHFLFHGQCL
jgi:hypothetical protein